MMESNRSGVVDLRELKALEIAARSRITFDGSAWVVPSRSTSGTYRVAIGAGPSCSCEDFQLRKLPCKHVVAARLVCERDHGGMAPTIVVDAVPKKPTYKQKLAPLQSSPTDERDRFRVLLFGVLRGLKEPEQPKTGRRRTLLQTMIYASALKVFTTLSSRRFAGELKDAHGRGYPSHLMNSVSVTTSWPTRWHIIAP